MAGCTVAIDHDHLIGIDVFQIAISIGLFLSGRDIDSSLHVPEAVWNRIASVDDDRIVIPGVDTELLIGNSVWGVLNRGTLARRCQDSLPLLQLARPILG